MSNINRLNLEAYPSFITTKTEHNYPLFKKAENSEIVLSAMNYGRKSNWFNLIAFVIMHDHLHLIIMPQEKNISQSMHSIKSYSSNELNKMNKRTGEVWQSSFRDFTIHSNELLMQKIAYIHDNPVRKGLVKEAKEYQFSSANPNFKSDIEIWL